MTKLKKETIEKWNNLLPITYRVQINSSLLKSQDVDRVGIGIIFGLHGQKLAIFDEARSILQECAISGEIPQSTKTQMLKLNDVLDKLEFTAQKAWNFKEDSNYHNWWLDMPGCSCPQMDNRDRLGCAGSVYIGSCPWHGWFEAKTSI